MMRKRVKNKIATPIIKFAMTSFAELVKDDTHDRKNLIYSPYSLYLVLSILFNGASGKVATAISEVLNVEHLTFDELNDSLRLLSQMLSTSNRAAKFTSKNSLLIKDQSHINQDFIRRVQSVFSVDVKSISGLAGLNIVNKTHIDAYWAQPFQTRDAKMRKFFLTSGESFDCDMMTASHRTCKYYADENFEVLRLPYDLEKTAMYLYLPDASSSLSEFLSHLSFNLVQQVDNYLYNSLGEIYLPPFKFSNKIDFNNTLKDIGLADAFSFHGDNWQLLSDQNDLYLESIEQEAEVTVDFHKTVAEAITVAAVPRASLAFRRLPKRKTFEIEFNRPFFFMIRDEETRIPIFMGIVSDPR